jgi:hypothetical protein
MGHFLVAFYEQVFRSEEGRVVHRLIGVLRRSDILRIRRHMTRFN